MTRFPFHLAGSIAIGGIVWTLLWHQYPEDGIPLKLIAWVSASIFAVSILFTIKRSRQRFIIAGFGTAFTLLLSMILANDYFQYYPTIGSLFGSTTSSQNSLHGSILEMTNHKVALTSVIETSYSAPANLPSQGTLKAVSIPGPTSHFDARQSFVYEPPALATAKQPALPVLILLSGVPGNPGDWKDRLNLQSTLDLFAAKHKGLAPLVVVADQTGGDGFTSTGCVDSDRGNAETYLTVDVPAYIKSHYNVMPSPQSWAIGGASDGGACSTVLAARHPDIFSTFMSLSGETSPSIESKQEAIKSLFGGSLNQFNKYDAHLLFSANNASTVYAHTAGWLAIGRDEQQLLVQDNRTLFEDAKRSSIEMVFETLPGHHGFGLWKQAFGDALPWVSQHIGLTS